MSTFQEYKDALNASDEFMGAVIMDRAAVDYSLTMSEFLDLIQVFDRRFWQV